MRRYPLLPRSLHRFGCRVRFALTMLAATAIAGFFVLSNSPDRPPKELVRWTSGTHDWLLVGDRERDRINAYDARDGRPLGTLDRTSGLADVDRLVLEGSWLVVLGDGDPQVVRLPDLRPQSLAVALQSGKKATAAFQPHLD